MTNGSDHYAKKECAVPLISGDHQLERFEQLARAATKIDIAVAWASSCYEIDILEASGAKIRAIVGTSGNSTTPTTLHHLIEFADLRIPRSEPRHIFHPKYYLFHGDTTICWIGSANLSKGGFGRNVELIHEFKLTRKQDREWFEDLWKELDPDPMPAIVEYEGRYKPPPSTPAPTPRRKSTDLPALAEVNTWGEFVEGLKSYDDYYRSQDFGFDVLGETHSWLHMISSGHEVISRVNWNNLTMRECCILRGIDRKHDEEGVWGHLGWVRGGGSYVFNPSNMPNVAQKRNQIQRRIRQILTVNANEVVELGCKVMSSISRMRHVKNAYRGIGPAAATRWLALARPDAMVSINKASAHGLGSASSLPQSTAGLASVYPELLAWIHDRNWYNEFNGRQPRSPIDRDIWNCRAALVDVFVYEP